MVLAGGAHLRLIGLDTPELGRDRRPPQDGADAAREFLQRLLPAGSAVRIVPDAERSDAHGRRLGHLFLDDGANVQQRVLAAGLATPLTVPPNVAYLECYRAAAAAAEQAGLGLWRLPRYREVAAHGLPDGARGYHRVAGRVSRRSGSRDALWIELDRRLTLRIARTDLEFFTGRELERLTGLMLAARGMIYARHGQLRMRIRHPADLSGLPPAAPATRAAVSTEN